jgi:citrate lyase subunit beta/citryl-CoA lyase
VHPVDHPAFVQDLDTLLGRAVPRLAYLMVPKAARHYDDVQRACDEIDHFLRVHPGSRRVPVHVLIETHGALREVDRIAAHPRIESLSFGLMDFVSAHRGAIRRRA